MIIKGIKKIKKYGIFIVEFFNYIGIIELWVKNWFEGLIGIFLLLLEIIL